MANNIELIPASELPVAEGAEIDVLCIENGELKRKEFDSGVKSVNGIEPDDSGNVEVNGVKSVNGIEPDDNGNVEVNETYDVVIDLGVLPEEINGSCFNHVTVPADTYNKLSEKLANGEHPKGKFMYTIIEKYTDDNDELHENIMYSSIEIASFAQSSGVITVAGYYSALGSFYILSTNIMMDSEYLYSTCMYTMSAELIQ